MAQDPVKVDQKRYRMELENFEVGVLRFNLGLQKNSPMQEHLASVLIWLGGADTKLMPPEGDTHGHRMSWADRLGRSRETVGCVLG